MMIPRKQQGSSTWNFWVEYLGLRKYELPEMIKILSEAGFGYLDLLHPDELKMVTNSGTGLKVGSTVMLDYDGKGHPPFQVGPNNPANHDLFVANTKRMIDAAAASGVCDCVTVFFGDERVDPFDESSTATITLEDGIKNCVAGYKQVVGHAESKGVNLALELLSSIERDHGMKGHPSYQGDRLEQCQAVINQVGSKRLGLLLDVYHFALMEPSKTGAEWIRHLGKDGFVHFHEAGADDRNEPFLDKGIDHVECAQALTDIGWKRSVIHEYLPTEANVRDALIKSADVYTGA